MKTKVIKKRKVIVNRTTANENPGTLYLLKGKGFHGLFPGCYMQRYKIGFTRNLGERLNTFESSQMPCDLIVVHTCVVKNVEEAENNLHRIFEKKNVKMKKSREWFDLNILDLWRYLAIARYFELKSSRYSLKYRVKTQISLFTPYITKLLIIAIVLGVSTSAIIFMSRSRTAQSQEEVLPSSEPPVQI